MSVASRPLPLGRLLAEPWAVAPSTISALVDHIAQRGDPREFFAQFGHPPSAPAPRRGGAIAVVPIHGFISARASIFDQLLGGTSVEAIRDGFRAAMADPSVSAIVLDVDSPGGTVNGVPELAAEIRAARGQGKRITAVANTLAGSAAYWLAAQADEVIASPSATVGSVGIFAVHQEISKHLEAEGVTTTVISAGDHKTDVNEYTPITEDGKAGLQERADALYDLFVADIEKGRRIPAATIRDDWGARHMLAKAAAGAGMVDFVGTFDDALRRAARAPRPSGARAEDGTPDLIAEAPEPFTDRLSLLAEDAAALAEHGTVRASLRAKEGRAAFSDTHLASVRSTRDAMDALLALADPAPAAPPAADPPKPPAVQPPPVVQPVAAAPRFRSDAEWQAFITKGNRR